MNRTLSTVWFLLLLGLVACGVRSPTDDPAELGFDAAPTPAARDADPADSGAADFGESEFGPAPGRCPAHTVPTDDCAPEDPLCWTLDSGQSCLSDLCPVPDLCLRGAPVDACPDGRTCRRFTRCGRTALCARPVDCEETDGECAAGLWCDVVACAPTGRACRRITSCWGEYFCQAPRADGGCGP